MPHRTAKICMDGSARISFAVEIAKSHLCSTSGGL
jgi:hypothetical protein